VHTAQYYYLKHVGPSHSAHSCTELMSLMLASSPAVGTVDQRKQRPLSLSLSLYDRYLPTARLTRSPLNPPVACPSGRPSVYGCVSCCEQCAACPVYGSVCLCDCPSVSSPRIMFFNAVGLSAVACVGLHRTAVLSCLNNTPEQGADYIAQALCVQSISVLNNTNSSL